MRERTGRGAIARADLGLMQEHEIDIALRIQFATTITTHGHHADPRELPLHLRSET